MVSTSASRATASRVAVVHVADPRGRWSVSAAAVARIIPAAEWRAAPPVDVLAALGPRPDTRGAARLLVMQARGRELALFATGALAVAEVDAQDVLPLPGVLTAATPSVSAIIVASDASLSLLIEPSAVIPSSDTVVGEELCPSHS